MSSHVSVIGSSDPTSVVIWCHGLGDSPAGWTPFARKISRQLNKVQFLLPTAPVQPVSCNGGLKMTSWMDLLEIPLRINSPDNGKHISASIKIIHDLIDKTIASGVSTDKIIVGGFSQGAALALCSTIKYKKPLGGCVVLSGWVLPKQEIGTVLTSSECKTPFLICHGEEDGVVLFENAPHMSTLLQENNCQVSLKTYKGLQHGSCPREEHDVLEFLKTSLSN